MFIPLLCKQSEEGSFRLDLSHDWSDDDYWSDDEYWLDDDYYSDDKPCLCELAHTNPYEVLQVEEEGDNDEETATITTGEGSEEVCLFPTIWMKWTVLRKEEEVCLGGTVWKKWSKVVNVVGEWNPRINTRVIRSWRRTGRRQPRRKNRRRRETRRRRRALRRKKLHRRGHMVGRRHRRRRIWLRGGANPDAEVDQVCFVFVFRRSVVCIYVCDNKRTKNYCQM